MNDRRRRFLSTVRSRRRTRIWAVRVGRSFGYALQGLAHLLTQRNAQLEMIAALAACLLGAWLELDRIEWALLLLTIALVLCLEAMNTGIEAAVDLASPAVHPLARVAKDVAAAAVTIAAVISVLVGLLLLGPKLWDRLVG